MTEPSSTPTSPPFRERSLAGVRYPYVWLDAQYEKVREGGRC
jgi:transposase-like protein